jgi:hypothetical protein
LLVYVGRYFGVKVARGTAGTTAGAVTGLGSLLVGFALALRLARRGELQRPLPAALLALMVFPVSTAFLTSLGRMNFGVDQAAASRYQTFVLLYYFALVLLGLLSLAQTTKPALRTALLAAVTLLMLLYVSQYPRRIRVSRARVLEYKAAALAMLTGVPDPKALTLLYPDPEVPWRDLGYIREHRWFMFSGARYAQLDQALTSLYRLGPPDQCVGKVEEVQPVGQIEGFALEGFPRSDVQAALHSSRAQKSGWQGYVRLPELHHRLDVYGVVKAKHGELCPIGSTELQP